MFVDCIAPAENSSKYKQEGNSPALESSEEDKQACSNYNSVGKRHALRRHGCWEDTERKEASLFMIPL